jgi:hypothetical protein
MFVDVLPAKKIFMKGFQRDAGQNKTVASIGVYK